MSISPRLLASMRKFSALIGPTFWHASVGTWIIPSSIPPRDRIYVRVTRTADGVLLEGR